MNRRKLIKRIVIGLALLIVIGFTAMVFITGYIVFSNTTQLSSNDSANAENSMTFFEENGKYRFDYADFQEKYMMKKIELTSSYDEHTIPGDLIYTNDINNDTVIMIHGLGGNRVSLLPIAVMFLEHGYNVLTYDQRSAGENFAPYTTFGYLESYDTADGVAYLDETIDADKKIHIWGASNGGATAGIALSRGIVKDRVASLILDCAISNTEDMMRYRMGSMDIGISLDFLMFSGNIYNRLALGFSYSDASAEECLRNSTLPVLILATKADETTPFFMAENLHEAASGSIFAFVEDSPHVDEFFDYPDWYEEQVFSFINSHRE